MLEIVESRPVLCSCIHPCDLRLPLETLQDTETSVAASQIIRFVGDYAPPNRPEREIGYLLERYTIFSPRLIIVYQDVVTVMLYDNVHPHGKNPQNVARSSQHSLRVVRHNLELLRQQQSQQQEQQQMNAKRIRRVMPDSLIS
uniref:Uncharacterized protein n=1 Tax=Parascaris equorum TaxID=6256 RepID=A0A914RDI7_PAREQ